MAQNLEFVKGSINSLLLCLLSQQPMYGYQVIKELAGRSEGYFRFKEGTLYPALHRLEKESLVTGKWQMLPDGRQRKYYHITEKGRQVLVEKQNKWRDFLAAMNLILRPASV